MTGPLMFDAPRAFTDGRVDAATLLWRFRGRLMATVVAKASFTLVAGDVCTHRGAVDLSRQDVSFGRRPLGSVELPNDLVPYKPRCDVTLVGHACAPEGRPVPSVSVRLALIRERQQQRAIDKVLQVVGDRSGGAAVSFDRMPLTYERALGGVSTPNPVGNESPNVIDPADPRRTAGFGAIAAFWPARKRLLAPYDRRVLDGPVPSIPEDLAWDYFQHDPEDQQTDPVVGGEWLVLDGLDAAAPRIQTRLPGESCAALLVVARPGEAPAFSPVAVVCDGVEIWSDRYELRLTWRGSVAISDDVAPFAMMVAALHTPGDEPDWAPVVSRALEVGPPSLAAASMGAPRAEAVGEGTLPMANRPSREAQRPAAPAVHPHHQEPQPPPQQHVPQQHVPQQHVPQQHVPQAPTPGALIPIELPPRNESPGEATRTLRDDEQESLRWAPEQVPFGRGLPKGLQTSSILAPGLPWSPGRLEPAPAAVPGEETLSLGGSGPARPPPMMSTGREALAEQLRKSGATAEEIAELLAPVPPPLDER